MPRFTKLRSWVTWALRHSSQKQDHVCRERSYLRRQNWRKSKHFYLTHTCSFTPRAPALLLLTYVLLQCPFHMSVYFWTLTSKAKILLFVTGRQLLWQCKGSSALNGWFTVGPKLDLPWTLKGQLLHLWAVFSAVQLKLRENGVLLARTCLKDMLLLHYTKCWEPWPQS